MSKPIATRTVAEVRHDPAIASHLNDLTGLPEDAIRARLLAAHGSKQVRKLFAEEWPWSASALGGRTAAHARDYELNEEIRWVTKASQVLVSRRLNDAPGNMLLRNLFEDCWPDEDAAQPRRSPRRTEPPGVRESAPPIVQPPLVGEDADEPGIEEENTEAESITHPYDPNRIRVKLWTPTVDLVLRRIEEHAIDLAPDFQREAGIWKDEMQSRLIESLLIRIPLPSFYFDGENEDRMLVIDGIQRLTALRRFVAAREFPLRRLEYLGADLEGKRFDELPRPLQRRIEETMLTVHVIDRGTPEEAKLNIFKRLNKGGEPLRMQEIRHAMAGPGPVRGFLRDLADLPSFKTATRDKFYDRRMTDRECALRFCAFVMTAYSADNLDTFLSQAMRSINAMSDDDRATLRARFDRALRAAHAVLGVEAFRKPRKGGRGAPVNKALFEAWTVAFNSRSDEQIALLVERRDMVAVRFVALATENRDFVNAITQSTGDPKNVRLRFSAIDDLLRAVTS